MASATFAAEGHLYQQDGVTIPSVTQVLALSGIADVSGIPLYRLERAAAVGTAVHAACHFLDEDDLDLESVHPEIVGYVLAYQLFKTDTGFLPRAIEQRGVAEAGGLASATAWTGSAGLTGAKRSSISKPDRNNNQAGPSKPPATPTLWAMKGHESQCISPKTEATNWCTTKTNRTSRLGAPRSRSHTGNSITGRS